MLPTSILPRIFLCDNCVCDICICPSIVKPTILPSIWLVKTVFSKTDLCTPTTCSLLLRTSQRRTLSLPLVCTSLAARLLVYEMPLKPFSGLLMTYVVTLTLPLCKHGKAEVAFLSHTISASGICPLTCIEAVRTFPVLRTRKHCTSCLAS